MRTSNNHWEYCLSLIKSLRGLTPSTGKFEKHCGTSHTALSYSIHWASLPGGAARRGAARGNKGCVFHFYLLRTTKLQRTSYTYLPKILETHQIFTTGFLTRENIVRKLKCLISRHVFHPRCLSIKSET